MIKSEDARLNGWTLIDLEGVDVGTYVEAAKARLEKSIDLPPGYSLTWAGQYEYMERAKERLRLVVPMTLAIVAVLLYLNFRTLTETLIVMLSVPFALIGGIWLLWWLDYNLSVAVAVGFIALGGVAAETGVIMLIYLQHAWRDTLDKVQAQGALQA